MGPRDVGRRRLHDARHAAPSWLWSTLVTAMLASYWTVEQTRNSVKAVAGIGEPPAWADAAIVAAPKTPIEVREEVDRMIAAGKVVKAVAA